MTTLTKQHKVAINRIVDEHVEDENTNYHRIHASVLNETGLNLENKMTWSLVNLAKKRAGMVTFNITDLD
jgi:hypothetical protein